MVAAVPAERDALAAGLADAGLHLAPRRLGRLDVLGPRDAAVDLVVGGVGPVAAAATTGAALAAGAGTHSAPYDVVVCVGIAGGFAGRAEVGDLVIASELRAADLGSDSDDGFLPLDELGFGPTVLPTTPLTLPGLTPRTGPVLTVSAATGTDRRAGELAEWVDPVAEAMEGFGVGTAAVAAGVGVAEIRGISNRVGTRDRAVWDVPAALGALRAAGRALADLASAAPVPAPDVHSEGPT